MMVKKFFLKGFTYTLILTFISSCALFNKENENKPTSKGEILYSYGTNALIQKDYTLALQNFLLALQEMPKDSRVHNNLGVAYHLKGRQDEALQHFLKAIDLDKNNSDAKNNLASLYFTQGKLKEAESLYQEVAQDLVYPSQHRVSYNLGLIQLQKKDYLKAKYYFSQAVEISADYCPAHYQLGLMAYNDQVYEDAFKQFQKASYGTCYEEPAPILLLGRTLLKLEKTEFAREKFEDLVTRFPETEYAKEAKDYLKKIANKEFMASEQSIKKSHSFENENEGLTKAGIQGNQIEGQTSINQDF